MGGLLAAPGGLDSPFSPDSAILAEIEDGRGALLDSRIHARFYRASKPAAGTTDFHDVLLELAKKPKAGDREVDIGDEVIVRLERGTTHKEFVEGELCRVQKVNFPPQAGPDGLKPLPLGQGMGFGHVVAFSYHVPTRVLLIQRNILSITSNRLALYVASSKPGCVFAFAPVLSEDAMKRFKDKTPRAFEVTFAGPDNLAAFDDENIPAAKGARMIAEAYDGIRVTIGVSVGKSRKKHLDKDEILNSLGKLVQLGGVKKLKVKAADGGDDTVINFIKEQLQAEHTLKLPDDDPDKNYEARKLFLRKVFSDNLAALEKQFKP